MASASVIELSTHLGLRGRRKRSWKSNITTTRDYFVETFSSTLRKFFPCQSPYGTLDIVMMTTAFMDMSLLGSWARAFESSPATTPS